MDMVIFGAFFFIFGSMIGSFLNAVIHRVPRKMSLVTPRSTCPKCNKMIYWYENIPLLSYIFLRGRCSKCKTWISFRYFVVELICGVAALVLMPIYFSQESLIFFLFYFSVFSCLLSLLIIDLEHQLLPDSLNLFLLICVIPFSVTQYNWTHWLLGGVAGFGFPFLITWAFYLLRGKIGLGGGDIKLFGVLGILLGLKGIFLNIFLSCFVGSIVGISLIALFKQDKSKPIPFGPFIILVAFVQIYFPEGFSAFSKLLFGL